jgi:hypothetical protein
MANLSPAAEAVMNAFTEDNSLHDWKHNHYNTDALAAALRAAVAHTQLYQGNDCYSNEVWTCDSDELLSIAAELEGDND